MNEQISTNDYVYVLPDYESFKIGKDKQLHLEYAEIGYKELISVHNFFVDQCFADEEVQDEDARFLEISKEFENEIASIKS